MKESVGLKKILNYTLKDSIQLISLILTMLFASNFANAANYALVMLSIMVCIYGVLEPTKIRINMQLIVLAMFTTTYFFIYKSYYTISLYLIVVVWMGPVIGYLIGNIMTRRKDDILGMKVIFSIVIGMFFHGSLNMIQAYKIGGDIGRAVPDIWTGGELTATLQGTFFTMIVCLLFTVIIVKNVYYKFIIVSCIIFTLIASINTASRTLLYITILVFILNVIIYIYNYRIKLSKVLKISMGILVIVVGAYIIYTYDIFSIRTWYESSPLYLRVNMNNLNVGNDPRFDMYRVVLENMWDYPMGGNKFGIAYAHNLWLDTIKLTGLIPGGLLAFYSILTLKDVLLVIINDEIEIEKKHIIFSLYVGITANFMVEPILEGVPYMFICMCILNGHTRKMLN